MSIKDLFGRQVLSDKNKKDLASDIESADNLKAIKTKQDSFVPQVDYDNPDTFAKYGSANLYYKSAIERIINYYPYDGSDAEINTFYNKSLDIEKYIFDKKYPRTTGYIKLSTAGTSTSIVRNGYGLPTTLEYITFNGGPNTVSETGKLSTLIPDPTNSKFQYNNLYDDNLYVNNGYPSDYGSGTRESNLKSDFDTGVTVEFWTSTGSIEISSTEKQVVFDMWNNNASSSADYGRITIELDGTAAASPWLITVQSGATGIFQQTLGQELNLNSLEDWKHYAFVFQNSGSDFHAKLYVNGELEDTNIYTSTTIGELTPNAMQGRLGALLTAPATLAVGGVLPSAYIGAGKLSGSIDEFRFWKTARNAEQIGRNWFTQIRGGVNTDIANTTLGMYYKFNEGITGTSSIDSVVLDYGGRVCNGTWTGYSSVSRNTGSAIVSASAANFEYLDPIIYDTHPDVVTLKSDLEAKGLYHDRQNSTQFINLIPSWVLEEVQNDGGADGDSDLEKLSHIMGAYFDKLYLQISALPKLRHEQYTSSSYKPLPFAQHLPESLGLMMPEIFVDGNVLEKFANRNDSELYESELNDTKNIIYQNLYNSLTSIYKSKGTERSIRNVLRCFNVDDNLVYFKTYSDNQTYELNTNVKQTLKKKKRLNFNTASAAHAVMYQDADPAIPDSQGFITGGTGQPAIDGVPAGVSSATGSQDRYGFTVESSIYFPRFFNIADSYQRNFFTASLFGMQTVFTGSTGTGYAGGTTSLTGAQDIANFQVYAIRDDLNSRNVRFKLTSSFDPHPFDALESQTFMSAYNSENWNLSVGLRPTKKFSGFVSGSDDYAYEVVFRGFNNKLGTINNSFAVSASITAEAGKNMIRSNKRLYVGAQNTNLTGANVYPCDVEFNGLKYWTQYIDDLSLKQHSLDRENAGISGSYQNTSPFDSENTTHDVYNLNALALNWHFGTITGSDSSGNFYSTDISSGSAFVRDNFGWNAKISGYPHPGKGHGFRASSDIVVNNELVNEYKFIDPELVTSDDMVNVLDADDELYGLFDEVPSYVHTVEKSLYAAISEEILDYFAGAVDFNNIIGDPVHRYRENYKPLETLREIYFKKFNNIRTVEAFTEYYKWFDDAIANIIEQIVPASANFVGDAYNVVESHILERPKYKSQFPTIEFKTPELEASLAGAEALRLSYIDDLFGGVEASPRPTNIHKNYWKKRAQPGARGTGSFEISSGDAEVDAQRVKLRNIMHSRPAFSASNATLSQADGTTYQRNHRLQTQLGGTVSFGNSELNRTIKGGVNFPPNKSFAFAYASTYPAGPVNTTDGVFIPENVLLGFTEDFTPIDNIEQWNEEGNVGKKRHRTIGVVQGRDYDGGYNYTNIKSNFAFPFNIMSGTIKGGADDYISARLSSSVTITNLHNDVYGDELEKPMQGPFTEYAVGGHQSRHVSLNSGSDDYTNRAEAWKILLGLRGPCPGDVWLSGAIGLVSADYPWPEANEVGETPYPMTASHKAVYYRDFVAKRPVNIRNILMRTGSTILGNYEHNYEVVHSFDTYANPRQFIETQPALPTQIFQNNSTSSTQTRTFLDLHRTDEGHYQFVDEYNTHYLTGTANKSIIATRFSTVGGALTDGTGYRDFRSNTFSPYNAINNRYLTVIKPSQGPSGSISEATGSGTTGIRVYDIHGKDYGLNSHYARHTARFGRDSLFVTAPGTSYEELPGFHKTHRNNICGLRVLSTNIDHVDLDGDNNPDAYQEISTIGNKPLYDNFNIQHQIPRDTRQYAWIAASLESTASWWSCGFTPARFEIRSGSTMIEPLNFVSASEVGRNIVGISTIWFPRYANQPGTYVNAFVPQTPGINSNIYEPLTASTNTLGYPTSIPLTDTTEANTQYLNTSNIGLVLGGVVSDGPAFNNLMWKRGNQYAGANWVRMRQGDHPILVNERRNNTLSTIYTGSALRHFALPPVSTKGRPVLLNMDYANSFSTSVGGYREQVENVTLQTTYNNEMIGFNEQELNTFANINFDSEVTSFEQLVAMRARNNINLNWIVYSENLFPSARREFISSSTTRVGYDNAFWRDTIENRVTGGMGVPNSLGVENYFTPSSTDPDGAVRYITQSIWPLDEPSDFETRTAPPIVFYDGSDYYESSLIVSNSAGELQNTYSLYHFNTSILTLQKRLDIGSTIRNAGLYSRKHMLNSPLSAFNPVGISSSTNNLVDGMEANNTRLALPSEPVAAGVTASFATGSGEAAWQAPTLAGYLTTSNGVVGFVSSPSKPWYNDYDDFRYDIKTMAKGYGVVPEFRVSEQIEKYGKVGIDGEIFDYLEIPGTNLSSSQDTFYKDYSNSDFMQNFLDIKGMSGLKASEIRLTCKAAIKFNPYKGFYPAQRTLDLVSQFSRSYADSISFSYTGPGGTDWGTIADSRNIQFSFTRPLIQPLFAPGIMYNSIKSGLAVDYPVVTNGWKVLNQLVTGAADASGDYPENYMIASTFSSSVDIGGGSSDYTSGAFWDLRVPFEAIMNPARYLNGVSLPDIEPHPKSRVPITISASLNAQNAGEEYNRMSSNFFAEVGKFFLQGGDYTKLRSTGVDLGKKKFTGEEVYGARLRMRTSYEGSRTYENEVGSDGTNYFYSANGAQAFFKNYTTASTPAASEITGISGSYELPQDPERQTSFKHNFVMYSRPTAFGPAVSGRQDVYELLPGRVASADTGGIEVSGSDFNLSASAYGVKDSLNGYNWSFTPPYYYGEAWVDFIFRPSASVEYDLTRILAETRIVKRRYDPGSDMVGHKKIEGFYCRTLHRDQAMIWSDSGSLDSYFDSFSQIVPSETNFGSNFTPYASENINDNAMQLDSCLNLFGIEYEQKAKTNKFGLQISKDNEQASQRWVIQPKFETPMMNFADSGVRPLTTDNVTIPQNFGSESVPRGMWHQFGTLPSSRTEGIFMEIGDIPANWLKNHYEVVTGSSIYNNYAASGDPNLYKNMKSFSKLCGFDENNSSVRLGEVADRQTIREAVVAIPYLVEGLTEGETQPTTENAKTRKRFINIPTKRWKNARQEEEGSIEGDSLNTAGASIRRLAEQMERYVLPPQFDFLNNKDIDPIAMYIFEFKYELDKNDLAYIWQNLAPRGYEKATFEKDMVAHELLNTELLTEQNLLSNPNLRWMVFKVKQRGQTLYRDMITGQIDESTFQPGFAENDASGYPLLYNWPYDYISIVETINFDVDVKYDRETTKKMKSDTMRNIGAQNQILNKKQRGPGMTMKKLDKKQVSKEIPDKGVKPKSASKRSARTSTKYRK